MNRSATRFRFLIGAVLAISMTACATLEPYIPDFGSSSPPLQASTHVNPRSLAIIKSARSQIGKPYRWGGESPSAGYDCSGLVWWAFRRHGVAVPRVSWQQYSAGRFVERNTLRPGDLIFFKISTGKSLHVGIITERGTFIHSPSSGKHVMESDLGNPFWAEHYVGARRLLS